MPSNKSTKNFGGEMSAPQMLGFGQQPIKNKIIQLKMEAKIGEGQKIMATFLETEKVEEERARKNNKLQPQIGIGFGYTKTLMRRMSN